MSTFQNLITAIVEFFTKLFTQGTKAEPVLQVPAAGEQLILPTYLPLSWEKDHPERKAWSEHLHNLVTANWSSLSKASDITTFRSDWNELTKQEQINLFAELICWVTYYECDWSPVSNSKDVGNDDKDTWSVGLLQLSVTDQKNYGFEYGYNFKDLQDPFKNLTLGLSILAKQVSKYGRILMGPAPNKTGLYWAVLYPGGKYDKHEFIAKKTNAFPIKANRKPATTPQDPTNTPRLPDKESTTRNPLEITPWVARAITMLGWSEFNHTAMLATFCWSFTNDFKSTSVVGSDKAWCAGFVCGCLNGGSHSASADSYQGFGESCGYIFGAILPIRHASGGHHVNFFLWWIDESKKIAACLGGNQSNAVTIGAYDLSGNKNGHDEVVTGPRWPTGKVRTSGPYQPPGWKVGTKLGETTR